MFKWFPAVFAENGDTETIPNNSQLDNRVSFEEGYTPSYDLPLTDPASLPIERDNFNSLMNCLTGNIKNQHQNTYADWVPASDNEGEDVLYPFGAKVRFNDGVNGAIVYEVVNQEGTTAQPAMDSSDWVADNRAFLRLVIADIAYPVGSSIITTDPRNPAEYLNIGTWVLDLQGRALIGAGNYTDLNGDTRSFPVDSITGEFRHTLTVPELPDHSHTLTDAGNNDDGDNGGFDVGGIDDGGGSGAMVNTNSAGGNSPHNIMQPSQAKLIWTRTA